MENNSTLPETNIHKQYLQSLSEKEQKAYKIAKDHLGTSFDLDLSRGYREWLKQTLPADSNVPKES